MSRTRLATLGLFAIAFAACSLNPQPFPPAPQDNEDRGGSLNADGGSADSAGFDSGTPPPDDAGVDTGVDCGVDAGFDAPDPDASLDAELDAPNDVALSSD